MSDNNPNNDDSGNPKKSDEMTKQQILEAMYGLNRRSKKAAAAEQSHKFWNTQPVPQDAASDYGPIETKTVDQVRKAPYKLPASFEWDDLDVSDEKSIDEVYDLLTNNYVEDDENMFRFDYSREFLRWALLPPGNRRELIVGVRVSTSKKLVGFITGIPAHLNVKGETVNLVEINFLCVHKKLRSKRLAPVLIKEITRRVNLSDTWQAVYTAGVVIPTPISKNRYYHRSLNPRKLIDVGFSRLARNMTMQRTIKLYSVPKATQLPGMRKAEDRDVPHIHKLLSEYLKKFTCYPELSEDEVRHWLLPRENVVYSYVVEEAGTKKITDFISFYNLPSTVIGHPKHNILKAAYSYYNVPGKYSLTQLMYDATILAVKENFDVFNALDVMENKTFLEELKFHVGDGHLQYYLYNYKCPEMPHDEMGLVLL